VGDITGAIAALNDAIRLRRDLPEFHYALGLALAAELRWTEAADAYRTTVRLKPDHADG
jgi:Flp pilus assembly protein TadD